MIKLKLKDIVQAKGSLLMLSQQRLALRPAYNVSKIIKLSNKELESFNEERKRILEGRSDDDKGDVQAEILEALELDVELPVSKLTMDELAKTEMTAQDVTALEPFIDFGEDEENEPATAANDN